MESVYLYLLTYIHTYMQMNVHLYNALLLLLLLYILIKSYLHMSIHCLHIAWWLCWLRSPHSSCVSVNPVSASPLSTRVILFCHYWLVTFSSNYEIFLLYATVYLSLTNYPLPVVIFSNRNDVAIVTSAFFNLSK